ncbi:hypothetical protein HMPREF0043_00547 [Actinobaculum sp. oral taxon 183 str. F0552]|nr:hypothetical protein HMPREF0043_00547 [Actinobaculum sp. oral taxon 183 str. F0552]
MAPLSAQRQDRTSPRGGGEASYVREVTSEHPRRDPRFRRNRSKAAESRL